MKIYVLGGGNSPERDVSIRSASAVSKALREAGYEVAETDPADGLAFLDLVTSEDMVFPILHGAEGEDGVIQKLMEDKALRFLGSNSIASEKCFDKGIARQILTGMGVSMAAGASVTAETYSSHRLAASPHVLKAQRGGSSIGTYIVRDPALLDPKKVAEVFELDSQAILEELIDGPEITVPVLDGKALPVIEIVPPEAEEFNYENKYNGKSQEICPAVSIDAEQQKTAQALAEKVHKSMGCRHLSRVDIMLRKNGDMLVLEINTMPGMTNQSLFPLSARVAGLPMPDLMDKFVALVERDYK